MYRICTTEKAVLQQRRIEECLLSAMREKSYQEVSVISLCEQTGLSRKTFYRLFESKQDVLCALIDRAIREFVRFQMPRLTPSADASPELLSFYCYWKEQRPLLDALSKNGLSTMLYDRCVRHVMEEDSDILQQIGIGPGVGRNIESLMFFLSGLLTLVVSWHHAGYRRTPQEMAAITDGILSQWPIIQSHDIR